ncbi:hypothetical protein FGO68_gene10798 [Halteria grandinella]|uniref:Uncharacterized protein n=1 Tax=Halteria grandinella TaxID=5974 RepID=A0A8J8T6B3_HALGN|nr:hypothetical protein FGO68_gene10798 [Halteria grandinella]
MLKGLEDYEGESIKNQGIIRLRLPDLKYKIILSTKQSIIRQILVIERKARLINTQLILLLLKIIKKSH